MPEDTEEIYLTAFYQDTKTAIRAQAETTAYSSYSAEDNHIHIRTNNRYIQVGEYVVFTVKTNFPLEHYDWIIISKNLILNSGREHGGQTEKLTSTFSVVVSSEMAPGFHILVYGVTADDYVVTDSAYFPVQAINRHKIEFKLTQIKDHTMDTVSYISCCCQFCH